MTEPAQALIHRGIPFTFTTVDPANAHVQAVIGYDGRRGTLVIRDPYWRTLARHHRRAARTLSRARPAGHGDGAAGGAPNCRPRTPRRRKLGPAPRPRRPLVEHRRDEAQREFRRMVEFQPHIDSPGKPTAGWPSMTRMRPSIWRPPKAGGGVPGDQSLELERLSLLRDQARAKSGWRSTRAYVPSKNRIRSSGSSTRRSCGRTRGEMPTPSGCCTVPSAAGRAKLRTT